jgi:uncharacterized protein with HEPN domain
MTTSSLLQQRLGHIIEAIDNRNALAHEFFSVDYELVWKTLCNDLPNLRVNIMQILQSTSFN